LEGALTVAIGHQARSATRVALSCPIGVAIRARRNTIGP
jgi:hypothetical protein